jgi:hypothetical protein
MSAETGCIDCRGGRRSLDANAELHFFFSQSYSPTADRCGRGGQRIESLTFVENSFAKGMIHYEMRLISIAYGCFSGCPFHGHSH